MIELLRYIGLPVGISSVSGRIDEIIVIVHYLMLVLFIGWGIFFIISLVSQKWIIFLFIVDHLG